MEWGIVLSVYIGISLYYTTKKIKKSISDKTIDEDLNRNWEKLKQECIWFKQEYLRKKNRKKK